MEKDVEATFAKLAAIVASQLKINADLRAEIDALMAILKEDDRDFGPRFEGQLAVTMLSDNYQRQVGTAELIRKIVG
jgi:hypothetical protein